MYGVTNIIPPNVNITLNIASYVRLKIQPIALSVKTNKYY